ncbi:MAG: hypothetical protein A2X36_05420 [Elusimicrobia bacterium GWA2_69_24]|nr:MAG: hypothetical protein A2X36_05420 [Elusimicrobia bacterium GWA2_69_24]
MALPAFLCACIGAVLPIHAVSAPVPGCAEAYQPSLADSWDLSRESWDAECGKGHLPEEILSRAKTAFMAACQERFAKAAKVSIPDDRTVRERCAEGRPGERRLMEDFGAPLQGPLPQNTGKVMSGKPTQGVVELNGVFEGGVPSEGLVHRMFTGAVQRSQLQVGEPYPGTPVASAQDTALLGVDASLRTPGLRINSNIPMAAASDSAPLDPTEIARYIRIEPGKKPVVGWEAIRNSLGLIGVGGLLPSITQEELLARNVLKKLQESEEGRRVLRAVIEEARRAGKTVTVKAEDYDGTSVLVSRGVESLHGTRGEAHTQSFAYSFNRGFTDFKDSETALQTMAGNMGHEFWHMVWDHRNERNLPKYAKALDYDLSNEKSARMKGYLIALELNSGKANDYTDETRGVLTGGDQYFERMKTWHPYYSLQLNRADMADPLAAYQRTLKALKASLASEQKTLAEWVPRRRIELSHMEGTHGLTPKLTELHEEVESKAGKLPHDIEQSNQSIRRVTERIALLQSPKGGALLQSFQAAAKDPEYGKLEAAFQRDKDKLAALAKKKSLPTAVPTPGQLDWKEFDELVAKDKKENPDHWGTSDAK